MTKFKATVSRYGNMLFDSKKEMNRYKELVDIYEYFKDEAKDAFAAYLNARLRGEPDNAFSNKEAFAGMLFRQVPIVISSGYMWEGKKERDRIYRADFCYIENDVIIIEDVKSVFTRKEPTYVLKRFFIRKFLVENKITDIVFYEKI